jgi:Homeodomain-like domain
MPATSSSTVATEHWINCHDRRSRVRKQYFEEGMEAAINRRPPNREYHRKLDGEQEARLVALACSEPPEGQARWSLRLLADRMVELDVVEDISYQTVRRTLKKTPSSLT